VSRAPPRLGDRYRLPSGQTVRVLCVGETFCTLLFGQGRERWRSYMTLAEWTGIADLLTLEAGA
jgi:hypothetical protein